MARAIPTCAYAFVAGDGSYGIEVAGTSRHQDELEALAGGRAEVSANQSCVALLVSEPDNRWGADTVSVHVLGRRIGQLNREAATGILIALRSARLHIAECSAVIKGGWYRTSADKGDFTVWLDANPALGITPPSLHAEGPESAGPPPDDAEAEHDQRAMDAPSQEGRRGGRMRIAASCGVLALAAGALLWTTVPSDAPTPTARMAKGDTRQAVSDSAPPELHGQRRVQAIDPAAGSAKPSATATVLPPAAASAPAPMAIPPADIANAMLPSAAEATTAPQPAPPASIEPAAIEASAAAATVPSPQAASAPAVVAVEAAPVVRGEPDRPAAAMDNAAPAAASPSPIQAAAVPPPPERGHDESSTAESRTARVPAQSAGPETVASRADEVPPPAAPAAASEPSLPPVTPVLIPAVRPSAVPALVAPPQATRAVEADGDPPRAERTGKPRKTARTRERRSNRAQQRAARQRAEPRQQAQAAPVPRHDPAMRPVEPAMRMVDGLLKEWGSLGRR